MVPIRTISHTKAYAGILHDRHCKLLWTEYYTMQQYPGIGIVLMSWFNGLFNIEYQLGHRYSAFHLECRGRAFDIDAVIIDAACLEGWRQNSTVQIWTLPLRPYPCRLNSRRKNFLHLQRPCYHFLYGCRQIWLDLQSFRYCRLNSPAQIWTRLQRPWYHYLYRCE